MFRNVSDVGNWAEGPGVIEYIQVNVFKNCNCCGVRRWTIGITS